MQKIGYLLAFLLIIAGGGILGFDWYNTYKITQNGGENIDTSAKYKIIGEIAPISKIERTKKLNINIKKYQLLVKAYKDIPNIEKYIYNPNKDIKQNIIIKPTIYEYFKK